MSVLPTSEAPEIPELVALRGEDEVRAQVAFDRLWGVVRPGILRLLARREVGVDEAEDVSQEVATRLWDRRRTIEAKSSGAWVSLVRKTTLRNLADRWRAVDRLIPLEEEADVPDEELPYLDAVVAAALEHRRIFDAADELWLGETSDPVDAEVGAAVLALIMADGVPPGEAALMFGVDLARIDRWLEDPAVMARAVFASLCWPSDTLAGHVLRPERPLSPGELDGIANGRPTDGLTGWTAGEARAVCLRVRNGLEPDQIVRAASGMLDPEGVDEALRRARGAYPFRARARALLRSLTARGKSRTLTNSGLWRRVVFEYHARHGLARDHIVERAGPPAEEAKVPLGASTLDNWLSRGRIYAQLAAYLAQAAERGNPE